MHTDDNPPQPIRLFQREILLFSSLHFHTTPPPPTPPPLQRVSSFPYPQPGTNPSTSYSLLQAMTMIGNILILGKQRIRQMEMLPAAAGFHVVLRLPCSVQLTHAEQASGQQPPDASLQPLFVPMQLAPQGIRF